VVVAAGLGSRDAPKPAAYRILICFFPPCVHKPINHARRLCTAGHPPWSHICHTPSSSSSSREEVLLQLINSKCLPMLICGMEVCPLGKSDLRALDFVVDRFFMKLFQTGSIEVVRLAQCMFGFVLPSLLIEKRSNKFYMVM